MTDGIQPSFLVNTKNMLLAAVLECLPQRDTAAVTEVENVREDMLKPYFTCFTYLTFYKSQETNRSSLGAAAKV